MPDTGYNIHETDQDNMLSSCHIRKMLSDKGLCFLNKKKQNITNFDILFHN